MKRASNLRRTLAEFLGLALVLAVLVTVFSLTTRHFFTTTTFRTVANQIPAAVIVAVGMTFVLIIAGIDLSVGSVVGLSGSVLGILMARHGWPIAPAVLACLGTGVVCGLINGLVSTRWRIPSFIVTLGMLEAARGGAYLVSDSRTQYIGGKIEGLATASIGGLSVPFMLAVATVIVGQIVLSRSVAGRRVIAVGANEEAARLSGISVRPLKVAVFAACGMLAALAALIDTSRLASADPNAGSGFELQAIAAVVIGGTSLMGGRGSVVNTFFGVLIIAVLGAGLAQLGVQEPTKKLITGCVIVIAVILDAYRHRLHRRARE